MPISLKVDNVHPTLRRASLDDVTWIIENAIEQFKDSPYFVYGVDKRKARALLERLIADGQDNAMVLMSVEGDTPVGVIAAYAFEPLFSRTKVAIECLWFIRDEYRKGSRGRDMIDAYEYWAKLVGCSFIQAGQLSTSPEAMEVLYNKRGYEMTERVFQKRIEQ